jgi:hypothetical protein
MALSRQSKKIGLGIVIILVLIQFVRPACNISNDNTTGIEKVFQLPDSVLALLKTSCYDCHSNHTTYPWYAGIQPVAGWLQHHVEEGKEELNFSDFASYSPRRQYRKMHEIAEQMDKHEMPLTSYTLIHTNARLSNEQSLLISQWANAVHDSIKARYPADSLTMPRHP